MQFPKKPGYENPWKIEAKREQYNNNWIAVTEFQVRNPAGKPGLYGVVHYKATALGIIPVSGADTWLVGQYRFPFNAYSWEIPAGGGTPEEDDLEAAQRELQEETGLHGGNWKEIQVMQLSNSVSDEIARIFLVTDPQVGPACPTDEEQLELIRVPLLQAVEWVHEGLLTDSMTVAGLLRVENMLHRGEWNLPA